MIWTILCLSLHSISLIVSLTSLTSLPWTRFTHDSETYTHNLFSLQSSSSLYPKSDYDCLKSSTCPSSDKSLCALSEGLVLSRKVFLPFETIFLLFQILTIERLLLKLFNRPFGPSGFFLFLIWSIPLLKTIAIVTFLVISNVSVDSSNYQDNQIYAEIGIFLLFVSLATSFVATTIMLVKREHLTSKVWRSVEEFSPTRFLIPSFTLALSFVAYVLAHLYPVAGFQQFDEVWITMDQVRGNDEIQFGVNFACAAGSECRDDQETCNIFKALESARSTSKYFQYFSVLFGVIWVENLVHILANTKFSVNLSMILSPILYFAFLLSEFIVFAAKSHTSFQGQCQILEFKPDFNLCAGVGAIFYITSIIFCFLSIVFYLSALVIKFNFEESQKANQVRPVTSHDDIKKPYNKNSTDIDNSASNTAPAIFDSSNQTIITYEEFSRPIHIIPFNPAISDGFEYN